MTTAVAISRAKRLCPVVEVWSPPRLGFKGSWALAISQAVGPGAMAQAEQDALSLMSEGQIARVRMLNLDTGHYEPFPA
jgi:hypothetical protein